MTRAISVEGDIGEMLRRRHVPEAVLTLLRVALASASEPTLLAESAFARETVAQTMRLAEAVLDHWRRSAMVQPRPNYVRKVHNAARSACDSLLTAAQIQVVSDWKKRLGVDPQQARTPVTDPTEWSIFTAQIVAFAWETDPLDVQTLQRLADELGSLLVERQQSPKLVLAKLSRLLMAKRNANVETRAALVESLAPDMHKHKALLGVTGARELVELHSNRAEVTLTQVHPERQRQFGDWGRAADRVLAYARGVASGQVETGEVRPRSTGPHAFVSVTVIAPDTRAALNVARSALSESLDQYLAAHPSARIAIEPVAAVADPTLRASFHIEDARGTPMKALTPLEVPWPTQLLIPMRMATLMRASTSATTRGAMAWVVLESAGVEPRDEARLLVGKALALAMVRQRLIGAYRQLVADSDTNSEPRHRFERRAGVLRRRAQRLLRIDPTVPDAASLHLAAMRWSAASVMNERLAVLARAEETQNRQLIERLSVSLIRQDGSPSPRLNDFDGWARVLRLYGSSQPSTERETALNALLVSMYPHEQVRVAAASGPASAPSGLVQRLGKDAAWYVSVLEQLYVCRNLHLHAGVHDLRGAASLGMVGPSIVDQLFETWATWYAVGCQLSAVEVLRLLSDRFDTCLERLSSKQVQLEELDPKRLTAPDWAPTKLP